MYVEKEFGVSVKEAGAPVGITHVKLMYNLS